LGPIVTLFDPAKEFCKTCWQFDMQSTVLAAALAISNGPFIGKTSEASVSEQAPNIDRFGIGFDRLDSDGHWRPEMDILEPPTAQEPAAVEASGGSENETKPTLDLAGGPFAVIESDPGKGGVPRQ
jgi:hypothetical protein